MNDLSVKQLEGKKKELYEMHSLYKKIRDLGFPSKSKMYDNPEENGRKLDDLLSSYEPVAVKAYYDLQQNFKRDPDNVVDHLLGWFELEREIIVKMIKVKSLKLNKFAEKNINVPDGGFDSKKGFQEPMWRSRVNQFLCSLGEARSDDHFISINGNDCGDIDVLSVLRDLRINGPYSLVFLEQLRHLISSINDADKKALLMIGSESGFVS